MNQEMWQKPIVHHNIKMAITIGKVMMHKHRNGFGHCIWMLNQVLTSHNQEKGKILRWPSTLILWISFPLGPLMYFIIGPVQLEQESK